MRDVQCGPYAMFGATWGKSLLEGKKVVGEVLLDKQHKFTIDARGGTRSLEEHVAASAL